MFKLNHVQTDLRSKLDEEKEERKVHGTEDRLVNNSFNNKSKESNTKDKKRENNKSKFYTIDGIRYIDDKIEINAEISSKDIIKDGIGIFIDKRK